MHAVAAKNVARRKGIALKQELEKLKTSHNQTLLARKAEIIDLKVQLGSAQKRAGDDKYD